MDKSKRTVGRKAASAGAVISLVAGSLFITGPAQAAPYEGQADRQFWCWIWSSFCNDR